jgi:hypothetical protein
LQVPGSSIIPALDAFAPFTGREPFLKVMRTAFDAAVRRRAILRIGVITIWLEEPKKHEGGPV